MKIDNNQQQELQKEKQKNTISNKEQPEAKLSLKKCLELFSSKKEYEENNYDSDIDKEKLLNFDEELDFKSQINGVDLVF